MTTQRLWLVRHGQTEWAALGRHTGRTDVPLTHEGRGQALALRSRLAAAGPFALVVTSPLGRASLTADLAGFGEVVKVEPDLAEWDYGALEGLTTLEIRAALPEWTIWTGPWPAGESIDDVAIRADHVLDRARAAPGDVLLFSHGHLLRVLAARWVGLDASFGRLFSLSTGTLSVLGWDRETRVIETWNEACHLTDVAN